MGSAMVCISGEVKDLATLVEEQLQLGHLVPSVSQWNTLVLSFQNDQTSGG